MILNYLIMKNYIKILKNKSKLKDEGEIIDKIRLYN